MPFLYPWLPLSRAGQRMSRSLPSSLPLTGHICRRIAITSGPVASPQVRCSPELLAGGVMQSWSALACSCCRSSDSRMAFWG
eukprot:UN2749